MREIYGTKAAEELRGDTQEDTIFYGAEGDDTLFGNLGNDIFIGGTGKDVLDGGAGIDAASYTQATGAVIVDLNQGIATRIAKLMPLGDSITFGKVDDNLLNSGGYRTQLWQLFQANGLTIDFVGSRFSGPDSLGDKDYEGHPGKTIDWISGGVNGWLSTYQPDVVLLMIGTNDIGRDSASQMSQELSVLLDQIAQQLPDTQVLVASIPPINPAGQSPTKIQKVLDYNAAIPGIVDGKVAEGKKVKFVDMRSLTATDISAPPVDQGVHPTLEGYGKIANFWYDALLGIGIEQGTFSTDKDTLSNIENIIGTSFNDTLLGNAGANAIAGGTGSDFLNGGGGADTFVYQALTEGSDTITDFSADDFFNISAAGFGGGLVPGVSLSLTDATTGVFVSGTNPVTIGSSANFLYDVSTGILSFDQDGAGINSAVTLGTLTGLPSLSPEQFQIIA